MSMYPSLKLTSEIVNPHNSPTLIPVSTRMTIWTYHFLLANTFKVSKYCFTVDMDKIDALVEAAVYQLNQNKAESEVLPINTVAVKSLTIAGEEGEASGN